MTVNLDKVVTFLAAVAAVVLPVLVQDHVLQSKLATDLGLAVLTFITGYHLPNGKVFGAAASASDTTLPADVPVDTSAATPDMQQPQT